MRAGRAPGLAAQLALLWGTAVAIAPRVGPGGRRRLAAWCAARTLRTLNVRMTLSGTAPDATRPVLLVANHVSWLDVYVLNALHAARFVAKSEVCGWPLVGRIAGAFDSLFVRRDSKRDAARAQRAVAAALRGGDPVVVFPEGTTTDGTRLATFRTAFFQAAIDADVAVQPVALRYLGRDGRPSDAVPFVDEMTLVESLVRVVEEPAIRVEVTYGPTLATGGRSRRELASLAQRSVAGALRLDAARVGPDALSHPRWARAGLPSLPEVSMPTLPPLRIWSRVVPPGADDCRATARSGTLDPYLADVVCDQARRAGHGTRIELVAPAATADATLAAVRRWFVRRAGSRVVVVVRRNGAPGESGRRRPAAA